MRARLRFTDEGVAVRDKVVSRGTCGCPKYAYATRKLAKAAAAIARTRTGEPIHAYHCTVGHCWHIGHPRGWHAEQRTAELADAG